MSFHGGSAKAMIQGLGDRKKQTGQEVHFIHVWSHHEAAKLLTTNVK
jgi:hypothetical protein